MFLVSAVLPNLDQYSTYIIYMGAYDTLGELTLRVRSSTKIADNTNYLYYISPGDTHTF